jgi:hypothetical protein
LELAVNLLIQVFSATNLMDKNHSTIVHQPPQSKMNSSRTGLAHREKTSAQHKKMFSSLQLMEHGSPNNTLGVQKLQLIQPKLKVLSVVMQVLFQTRQLLTGTVNITSPPLRQQVSSLFKLNNTVSMSM